jgi:hypothetical protein
MTNGDEHCDCDGCDLNYRQLCEQSDRIKYIECPDEHQNDPCYRRSPACFRCLLDLVTDDALSPLAICEGTREQGDPITDPETQKDIDKVYAALDRFLYIFMGLMRF